MMSIAMIAIKNNTKNGGILVKNVEKFEVITEDKLTNVNENFSQNIDSKIQSVCIEVTFKNIKRHY